MKVLITGATGLIGQELTDLLLQNNHVVHYLTTSPLKIHNKANYYGFFGIQRKVKSMKTALKV